MARAIAYPVTPGSASEARKVVVWFGVKQIKASATEQFPLIKNRCTNADCNVLKLVIEKLVSCLPGSMAVEA